MQGEVVASVLGAAVPIQDGLPVTSCLVETMTCLDVVKIKTENDATSLPTKVGFSKRLAKDSNILGRRHKDDRDRDRSDKKRSRTDDRESEDRERKRRKHDRSERSDKKRSSARDDRREKDYSTSRDIKQEIVDSVEDEGLRPPGED